MTVDEFDLRKANRFLPHILLTGMGIGTANFFLNAGLSWPQWIIQSISTSLVIGYSLMVVATNKPWVQRQLQPSWRLYLCLGIVFFAVGGIASEVEQLIQAWIFRKHPYRPLSAGVMYPFNGIISMVMGFSFFQNSFFLGEPASGTPQVQPEAPIPPRPTMEATNAEEPITKIPVKQGENILLIATKDIAYFEAFDNYSFVYDLDGEKRLCDYSLLFLEERLGKNFLRVHRKYIVNATHIKQIKPHLNSRYLILFDNPKLAEISSSKGYLATMRKLVKIE
ncbi:MAG: LytTR family transcriptional regulator DNA-binding domain-containing protein [Bacteroidota bacterium]